ncbi:MAG TPA: right-handed parallel beta-helix repeat-containing protein [Chthoniobacterales bacterium]
MATSLGTREGNSPVAKKALGESLEKMKFEDGTQIQRALAFALKRGDTAVSIVPGNYRFKSPQALLIESANNLSIEAQGVTFWLIPGQSAMRLKNCANIRIHGLSVDYSPLPYAQGTVIRINRGTRNIEMKPTAGFSPISQKWLIHPGQVKALFYSRDWKVRNVRLDWIRSFERLDDGNYDLSFTYNRAFSPGSDVNVGDVLAMPFRGQPHCINLIHCSNIKFNGVTVFSAGQYGFAEEGGHGANQYVDCRVIRRPNAMRALSSNADAFHSTGVEAGPKLSNCEFGNAGDDLVNIHGYYGILLGKIGPNTIRALEIPTEAPEVGRKMEFADSGTFQILDSAEIKKINRISVNSDPSSLRALKGVLSHVCIKPLDKVAVLEITLDKSVEAPIGSLISIPAECGAGATISHCYLHSTTTRGLLIRGDRVTILGNRIADTGMEGIRMGAERYWLEAELPANVIVRENTLENCGNGPERVKAAIDISPPYGAPLAEPITAGKEISILNNRITDVTARGIVVCGVDGIYISGNEIGRKPDAESSKDQEIEIFRSKRAIIESNAEK